MGSKGRGWPNANSLNILLKEPRATVAKVKCSALGNSGQAERPLEERSGKEEDLGLQI